jgi:hypothetical protein
MEKKNLRQLKISGLITAISQIAQSGNDKTGAAQTLIRQDRFIETEFGEEKREVPFITGNSMRGKLRRLIIDDLLDRLEIKFANKDVFHAFFSGGLFQSMPSSIMDLDFRVKINELLPPISILGMAIGSQPIPGKLAISNILPCSREYKISIPESYYQYCNKDVDECLSWAFFTRKDESKQSIDMTSKREKDEQAIQMKCDLEVFIPGTRFYHEFVLTNTSELEQSCFAQMLSIWEQFPTLGMKSSTGFGQVKCKYEYTFTNEKYLQFLADKKAEIIIFLREIEAMMTQKPKAKAKKTTKKKEQTLDDIGHNDDDSTED